MSNSPTALVQAGNSVNGFFPLSNGVDARGGIFNDNSTVDNRSQQSIVNIYGNPSPEIAELLKPVDRYYVPPCMEGTRESIFADIENWIADVNDPNILWLSGSPGAGKSAIASTMATRLAKQGRPYSDFYFRRGDCQLSDPASLWRTVAWDLVKSHGHLVDTMKEKRIDPKRFDIGLQFNILIEPLRKTFDSLPPQVAPVVIIDALDECNPDRLQAVHNTFVQWSRLPRTFKLIITSRDERPPESIRANCKHIVLPTGDDINDATNKDIRLFFKKGFESLEGSDPRWPGEQVLNELTARAAGLFLWAEMVMKMMKASSPVRQLDLVLSGAFGVEDNLTPLYCQFLESLFRDRKDHELQVYRSVLSVIVLAKAPFHLDDLHLFVPDSEKADVFWVLKKLSPVISVGTSDISRYGSDDTNDQRLRVRHLSFSEFVRDPRRCPKDFLIGQDRENAITMECFRWMKDRLEFNICRLETSFLHNDEVEDLSQRIRKYIPEPLLYSCRFWTAHLRCTVDAPESNGVLLQEVRDFLNNRFLYWLEVISLVKEVSVANTALQSATLWIEKLDKKLSAFCSDARRFMINFDAPISTSVPHIYLSALPFSPAESLVAKHYRKRFPNLLSVTGQEQRWPAMINLLRGHTMSVTAVAFSQDGKRVVSGSTDKTVRVWDVEKCWILPEPFNGHKATVNSVSFSPDGTRVVSGSDDSTVIVWDAMRGRVVAGPFVGHKSAVRFVAFLPDNKHVISYSSDGQIWRWGVEGLVHSGPYRGRGSEASSIASSPDGKRISFGSSHGVIHMWDLEMDQTIFGPVKGHKGAITSMAFSSDGKRIVSGSEDWTICVWDVKSGRLEMDPLEGHTARITSTAFAPKGKEVVSGSSDNSIRVWDVETGQVIKGPFEGHTDEINSVAFSPDGKTVISGSEDKTIRIWDVATNKTGPAPSGGHPDAVYSVAFSPDGERIVSGSKDHNVRVWDIKKGQVIAGPLRRHTGTVFSVAFSPNGKQVVSGSGDRTICLWDVETEHCTKRFKGHTGMVYSVAISPDGRHVVSGSLDRTILVWDIETGDAISRPFIGHIESVKSVAFSPSGRQVVSGSFDGTVRVWDVDTAEPTADPFRGHKDNVNSVAFSPDGKWIVSGSSDQTICVWDARKGSVAKKFRSRHTDAVYSVQFSPDGKRLVSGSSDQTLCVWDVESGEVTSSPYECHTDIIYCVQFSPDGKRIVSCSRDWTVRIWDVEACRISSPKTDRSSMRVISIGHGAAKLRDVHYLTYPTGKGGTGWLQEPPQANNDSRIDRLFLWVPPTCRSRLYGDETLAVLGTTITRLDFSRFVYGDNWTKCQSSTDIIPSPIPSTPSLVPAGISQLTPVNNSLTNLDGSSGLSRRHNHKDSEERPPERSEATKPRIFLSSFTLFVISSFFIILYFMISVRKPHITPYVLENGSMGSTKSSTSLET